MKLNLGYLERQWLTNELTNESKMLQECTQNLQLVPPPEQSSYG
jgi:hypothetical protein